MVPAESKRKECKIHRTTWTPSLPEEKRPIVRNDKKERRQSGEEWRTVEYLEKRALRKRK